jgi:hypothetical protein
MGVGDVVAFAAGVAVGGDGEVAIGADWLGGASEVHAEIGPTASMTAAARMTGRDLVNPASERPRPNPAQLSDVTSARRMRGP